MMLLSYIIEWGTDSLEIVVIKFPTGLTSHDANAICKIRITIQIKK